MFFVYPFKQRCIFKEFYIYYNNINTEGVIISKLEYYFFKYINVGTFMVWWYRIELVFQNTEFDPTGFIFKFSIYKFVNVDVKVK